MNWKLDKISGTPDAIQAQLEGPTVKLPKEVKDFILSQVKTMPKATVISLAGFSADHKDHRQVGTLRQIEFAIKTYA